tara:strand:+ start:879 stop:1145 length:267 start_codon:yes stop_codon:yes gene_type:complete
MSESHSCERAFRYVMSELANKKIKKVTIGSCLNCFLQEKIEKKMKIELGFMILKMIADQKKRGVLNIPPEPLSILVNKIIEDMLESCE